LEAWCSTFETEKFGSLVSRRYIGKTELQRYFECKDAGMTVRSKRKYRGKTIVPHLVKY
jgi:hypothetical protein